MVMADPGLHCLKQFDRGLRCLKQSDLGLRCLSMPLRQAISL